MFNVARKRKTDKVNYEPQKLQLELTNACNLNCIECYRHSSSFKTGYMSYENFEKIIEQFPFLKSISLFGTGESFLHKDLFKMVDFLKRKNVKIFITTNGTLLNETNIKQIIDKHIHLTVSLDAVKEETYRKVSGKTVIPFDKIFQNISFFRQYNPDYNFTLTFMMMNENFEEAPEFVETASKLGVKKVTLGEQQFYENKPEFHIKNKELFKKKLFEAINIGEKNGVKVRHTKRDRTIWGNETKIEPCSFLWKQPFITWDGYWVLCCARPFPSQFNFGNILEKSFKELWYGSHASKIRKGILESDLKVIPFCRECQHLAYNK